MSQGWKSKYLGSGRTLLQRWSITRYVCQQIIFPFSHSVWSGNNQYSFLCRRQPLSWYCQAVETSLTYIPGSCPTPVVAVTLSACLTCLAYKSNTDDYLLLSDVLKYEVSFYDSVNNFMTMIHQALFNWSQPLVSFSRCMESVWRHNLLAGRLYSNSEVMCT